MKVKTVNIALTSIIAALYAVLVIALPFLSFMVFQVRIADSLLMLSTVIGMPAVIGVTLGCFISNFIAAPWGSLGLAFIDAIGGSIANFIASWIGYKIAYKKKIGHKLIASLIETLVISIIVGLYLSYIIGVHYTVTISGVLLGSIISIIIMGFPLSIILEKAIKHKLSNMVSS